MKGNFGVVFDEVSFLCDFFIKRWNYCVGGQRNGMRGWFRNEFCLDFFFVQRYRLEVILVFFCFSNDISQRRDYEKIRLKIGPRFLRKLQMNILLSNLCSFHRQLSSLLWTWQGNCIQGSGTKVEKNNQRKKIYVSTFTRTPTAEAIFII